MARFVCLVLLGVLALPSSLWAQGGLELTTSPSSPFTTSAGVCFDVEASTPLTVWRVGVASSSRSGLASSYEHVEVWTRDGGCGPSGGVTVPFRNQPAGWKLAGRGEVKLTSSRGIVQIPVDLNAFMNSGDVLGVAVYSPTFGNAFRNENPRRGSDTTIGRNLSVTSRENILYTEQVGLGGTVSQLTYYSRRDEINMLGTVWYDAGSTPQTTTVDITSDPQLPEAKEGVVYAKTIFATGGTPPYRYFARGLPPGLTLEQGTGLLSGIPSLQGSFNFDITVNDANSTPAVQRFALQVSPNLLPATPIAFSTGQILTDAREGTPYTETLRATGGGGALTWNILQPRLPWLALDASTGQFRGNPGVAHIGTFTIQIEVTDGVDKAQKTFMLTVAPPGGRLSVTTASPLPDATEGSLYSASLAATGGSGTYSWSASGLPGWLRITTSGVLTGTPPVGAAGQLTFDVTVDDGLTTATKPFDLTVLATTTGGGGGGGGPALVITSGALSGGTVGVAYSFSLTANGGTQPYTWSLRNTVGGGAPALPPGLALKSNGEISGTPTTDGTWTVGVRVADATAAFVERALTLAVAAAPGGTSGGSTFASSGGGSGGGCSLSRAGGARGSGALLLLAVILCLCASRQRILSR